MSEITVTIPRAAAMNIVGLIEERIDEIERLEKVHPTLPIRDPQTMSDYFAAAKALEKALGR